MKTKKYLNINVYEALQKRYEFIFNEFDVIEVSFSGGKDSGVLLNTIIDFMKKNNINKKIILQYMDYEGSYEYTEQFIKNMYEKYIDFIIPHWNCLCYKTACGVSMFQNFWLPWNPDQKNIWIRGYPKLKNIKVFTEENQPYDFYFKGIEDAKFDLEFTKWCHNNFGIDTPFKKRKTINIMGVRADESLHRYNAIMKSKHTYKKTNYIMKERKNIYHAYPLYDWTVNDIWHCNAEKEYEYNKLYDLYHQAGLSPAQMRVASPFIDEGVESLKLHQVIEPNTWSRLVCRVNGANFGNIYGGTSAMGFRKIILPKGHTWKSYVDFLLKVLPKETQKIYKSKFKSTFKVWLEKGATIHIDSLEDIKKSGYEFEDLGTPPGKIYQGRDEIRLIRFKEYPDNIDSKHFRNLPSYKRMCITIFKNDTTCKYMGYGMTTYEKELRQMAMKKYKNI